MKTTKRKYFVGTKKLKHVKLFENFLNAYQDVLDINNFEPAEIFDFRQFEYDRNIDPRCALYINNDSEISVGVYNSDGQYLLHVEDPINASATYLPNGKNIKEVNSFEEGINELKTLLQLNTVFYYNSQDNTIKDFFNSQKLISKT